ncbi:ribosome biogenesis protein SLX9-domain-containing protein [Epithele typhae]|uniref:ribosome biogenesis protein SLX9-domain-containing protein n=1 Tax=Epithele typhae TaxID=378194 RepID=UPI0020072F92|nr:ribosome biogenesis protein SLX9-domain-containing protein [Epithele typhae]KAH9944103.1 ribosome biogenesis protein SLX9-domain-containing protein [Epithele typhae]
MRSGAHQQSVRLLTQRQFAVQDNAVEHVEIGVRSDLTAPEILANLADAAGEEGSRTSLKKREKQALKHEIFMQRLEQSRSPYSKSHERRLRRKAREQVAGGLSDIKAALAAVEDDFAEAVAAPAAENLRTASHDHEGTQRPKKARPNPGQIGEGKKAPLSKNQRKRALQVERMRIPMILATPEFAANPFRTIRTHAENTLLKHEPPTA